MFNIRIPFVIAVAFSLIMFTSGVFYEYINPENFLKQSGRAYKSIQYYFFSDDSNLQSEPSIKEVGVTRNINNDSESHTLYSSMSEPKAFLIDSEGSKVHEWDLSFVKNIWTPALFEKKHAVINEAELLPNGDLITVVINEGSTPWGGGVVKVNKDSKLIWVYKDKLVHHDLSIDPQGNIYTLTHELKDGSDGESDSGRYLDDKITILNPEGKEIESLSIMEMIENSPVLDNLVVIKFKEIYRLTKEKNSQTFDPLHSNTIHYIDEEMANNSGFLKEGNVLVLLRNLDLIIEVDVAEQKVINVLGGPWKHPHHPLILSNGNILIFDNRGSWPKSAILEYDPNEQKIVWSYDGSNDVPLQSIIWGKIQSLDNGNVLVTQPIGGRIFEVNRDKEVVWEYSNPDTVDGTDRVWNISYAYRYGPKQLQFLNSKTNQKNSVYDSSK